MTERTKGRLERGESGDRKEYLARSSGSGHEETETALTNVFEVKTNLIRYGGWGEGK